jgi:hypothetical protein
MFRLTLERDGIIARVDVESVREADALIRRMGADLIRCERIEKRRPPRVVGSAPRTPLSDAPPVVVGADRGCG